MSPLVDPAHHVDYAYPPAGGARYPGIVVGDPERHVVWGLTYRFLEIFFQAVERPLPDRWQALRCSSIRPLERQVDHEPVGDSSRARRRSPTSSRSGTSMRHRHLIVR